ncbi:transglycosylase domain-containing protein [Stackebrandtia soli]|uniref:transglycosylase domain-containing protein n=1 Tax=Stackebrandtia soli TaxID=1892856 RepID=UPI0039E920E8
MRSNAFALLTCGLLAGLVVAAAAFPALAVTGLAAKTAADNFESLPAELADDPAPQTTWVFAKDGTLITSFYDESRKLVTLDEIAPVMIDAIIAAEDNRFYEHNGVDLFGVIRAAVANQGSSEVSQGASTLTMQYVRQALTYNAKTNEEILLATEDTPERKIREMRYAVAVEKELTKNEILEKYLNLVFLGNRSYGIYAASKAYFGKEPADLELPEAALLAALPKAPGTIDPTLEDENATAQAKDRRDYVLQRMADIGKISQADAKKAKKTEIELNIQEQPNECVAVPSDKLDWGYFCDYLKQWWMNNPEFGDSKDERLSRLKRGGYTITTTLEPDLQKKAQNHVVSRQGKNSPWAMGTVTITPGTGHIRSMALNRDYKLDDSKNGPHSDPNKRNAGLKGSYPNTTVPLLTGADLGSEAGAGFQSGSTFKFFTMLAALDEGIPLNTTMRNKSPYMSKLYSGPAGPATCGPAKANGTYAWCPGNDVKSYQDITSNMWNAFGRSINTYFVQLIERVGADKVVEMAERLGIDWRNYHDLNYATPGCPPEDHPQQWGCLEPKLWGTLTLGTADTTALDMAEAYATVAADGLHCEPMPVLSIQTSDGQHLEDAAKPKCDQAVSKDVARAAIDAMRCPVNNQGEYGKCDGQGTFSEAKNIVNRPIAGKTGTTDNNQAAWFVVTAKNATTSSFIADPDYRERSLENTGLHDKPHEAGSYTLRDALEGLENLDFKPPSEGIAMGKNLRDIPTLDCVSPAEAEEALRDAGFDPGRVNTGERSHCGKGKVYATSPSGKAPKGSPVDYFVSAGKEKRNNDRIAPVIGDEAAPPIMPSGVPAVPPIAEDPRHRREG